MTPERFPRRMRDKPRWICWRWGMKDSSGAWRFFRREELVLREGHLWHANGDGTEDRAEKLPVSAQTMRAASVANPRTWATFGEALAAWRAGKCDGLGYVLDHHEVLVDIDGCVEDGELSPFARACVNKLCSYAEFSVSGGGVHIVIVAEGFEPDRGMRGARCEVYAGGHTNRYCTVSGDVLEGFEELEEDGEDVLRDLYESEFADAKPVNLGELAETLDILAQIQLEESTPEDAHDVAWMCGHFRWGRALYARGDFAGWARDRELYQPNKDRSQSEADAALTSYLLAATGGNMDRTLTLLCRSAMWRPKYDEIHDGRHPYSAMTVARVSQAVSHERMRLDAIARRDERLEEYPHRFARLASLMREHDVTDMMLRHYMAHGAPPELRASPSKSVMTYRPALVGWLERNIEAVAGYEYAFDFTSVRR